MAGSTVFDAVVQAVDKATAPITKITGELVAWPR